MMKRNIRKKPFTLIELLVAMGLLTLLVMLMLQLFSGAQRLWIASDRRSGIYADTRAAMELMSDLISLVHFSKGEDAGGTPDSSQDLVFSITPGSNDSDSIIFAAKANRSLPRKDSNIRFISFRRGSGAFASKLYMTVCSDSGSARVPTSDNYEDNFYSLFPPYDSSNNFGFNPANRDAARTRLITELTPQEEENAYSQVIAENVVGLVMVAYKLQNDGTFIPTAISGELKEPPYLLEIRLSVLSKDDYAKYKELSDNNARKNFLAQHKYTFTRSVFLGNRWALQ